MQRKFNKSPNNILQISTGSNLLLLFLIILTFFHGNTAVMKNKSMTHGDMINKFKAYKQPCPMTQHETDFLHQYGEFTTRAVQLKSTRKEFRCLTNDERKRFLNAITKMKTSVIDPEMGTNMYDVFTLQHRFSSAPGAHGGPCFTVYHRMLLYKFEQALKVIDNLVSLPYWDSTLDSYMPNSAHSIMWTPDYLGTAYGDVQEGVCKGWKAIPKECEASGVNLRRENLGDPGLMMTDYKINQFLTKKSFAEAVSPTNTYFEDSHGDIHICLGGHMNDLMCSPNDLAFYLHHAFIDLLFENFRTGHPNSSYPNNDIEYNSPLDPLYPWYEYRIVDVYNSKNFTRDYYQYQQRPRTCMKDTHCCPPHGGLYCDFDKGICKAKVRKGGECNGLGDAACYCDKDGQTGSCQNGFCQCITGCKADTDCKAGEWCDELRWRCTAKCTLGQKCHTSELPNTACSGLCPSPSQPICYEYTCQCVELIYDYE